MSLPAIRAALATIIAATPAVTVNGQSVTLKAAYAYEPESPPEIVPCAVLGPSSADIEQGSMEIWTHAVPLTVLMHASGAAEMEWSVVEAFLLAVVAQIRSHYSANGTAAVVMSTGYTEGTLTYKDKPYRGFTLNLLIEDKFEIAGLVAA